MSIHTSLVALDADFCSSLDSTLTSRLFLRIGDNRLTHPPLPSSSHPDLPRTPVTHRRVGQRRAGPRRRAGRAIDAVLNPLSAVYRRVTKVIKTITRARNRPFPRPLSYCTNSIRSVIRHRWAWFRRICLCVRDPIAIRSALKRWAPRFAALIISLVLLRHRLADLPLEGLAAVITRTLPIPLTTAIGVPYPASEDLHYFNNVMDITLLYAAAPLAILNPLQQEPQFITSLLSPSLSHSSTTAELPTHYRDWELSPDGHYVTDDDVLEDTIGSLQKLSVYLNHIANHGPSTFLFTAVDPNTASTQSRWSTDPQGQRFVTPHAGLPTIRNDRRTKIRSFTQIPGIPTSNPSQPTGTRAMAAGNWQEFPPVPTARPRTPADIANLDPELKATFVQLYTVRQAVRDSLRDIIKGADGWRNYPHIRRWMETFAKDIMNIHLSHIYPHARNRTTWPFGGTDGARLECLRATGRKRLDEAWVPPQVRHHQVIPVDSNAPATDRQDLCDGPPLSGLVFSMPQAMNETAQSLLTLLRSWARGNIRTSLPPHFQEYTESFDKYHRNLVELISITRALLDKANQAIDGIADYRDYGGDATHQCQHPEYLRCAVGHMRLITPFLREIAILRLNDMAARANKSAALLTEAERRLDVFVENLPGYSGRPDLFGVNWAWVTPLHEGWKPRVFPHLGDIYQHLEHTTNWTEVFRASVAIHSEAYLNRDRERSRRDTKRKRNKTDNYASFHSRWYSNHTQTQKHQNESAAADWRGFLSLNCANVEKAEVKEKQEA